MFGSELATLKMSACTEAPSAKESSAARTKPLSREIVVPAAITALCESSADWSAASSTGSAGGWAGWAGSAARSPGPGPRGVLEGLGRVVRLGPVGRRPAYGGRRGPCRNRRTAMAPNSSAAPMPMNSQITLLSWAERIDMPVLAPSGVPRLSVTSSFTSWMPVSSVRAVSRTVTSCLAGTSIRRGPVTLSWSSVTASRDTVTGWSSWLVIVALNWPLELDSVTAPGALTLTWPSRSSIHCRDRSAAARLEMGRVRAEYDVEPRAWSVTVAETRLLRVSRFCSAAPLRISPSAVSKLAASSSAFSCQLG